MSDAAELLMGDANLPTNGFARTFEAVELAQERREDETYLAWQKRYLIFRMEGMRQALARRLSPPGGVVARPEYRVVNDHLLCECYYHPEYRLLSPDFTYTPAAELDAAPAAP